MSVLIRGMEMPYGCANCPFVSEPVYDSNGKATYFCKVDVEGVRGNVVTTEVIALYEGATEAFPRFCPLIEVQSPHGRLVDADAFKETIDYYIREANWSDAHNEAFGWAKEFIDNEQDVIEAEVEDVASHTRQLARQAGKILVDAALNAIKESEGSENG